MIRKIRLLVAAFLLTATLAAPAVQAEPAPVTDVSTCCWSAPRPWVDWHPPAAIANTTNAKRAAAERVAVLAEYGYIADGRHKSPITAVAGEEPVTGAPINTVQRCLTGWTYARWDNLTPFSYTRNAWCLNDPFYGYEWLFQLDGNWPIYRTTDGRPVWSPATNGYDGAAGPGTRLEFRTTGAIHIMSANGFTRYDNGVFINGHRSLYELIFIKGGAVEMITDWTQGECYFGYYIQLTPIR